jgi:hypothetical protein
VGVPRDALGDASENGTRETRSAVTTDDDEIGAARFATADELRVRFPAFDENFVELETELAASVLDERFARLLYLLDLLGFDDDAALRKDQGQVPHGGQHVTDSQRSTDPVRERSRLAQRLERGFAKIKGRKDLRGHRSTTWMHGVYQSKRAFEIAGQLPPSAQRRSEPFAHVLPAWGNEAKGIRDRPGFPVGSLGHPLRDREVRVACRERPARCGNDRSLRNPYAERYGPELAR